MTTSVEFYRKLREHIPDEAAKMIAEELVPAEQVATKADLAATEHRLSKELHEGLTGLHRWMLTFFAAQWLGTVGIIVAIFLKH